MLDRLSDTGGAKIVIHLSDRAEAFRLADFAETAAVSARSIVGFFFGLRSPSASPDAARGAIGDHAFAFTIETMRCREV